MKIEGLDGTGIDAKDILEFRDINDRPVVCFRCNEVGIGCVARTVGRLLEGKNGETKSSEIGISWCDLRKQDLGSHGMEQSKKVENGIVVFIGK